MVKISADLGEGSIGGKEERSVNTDERKQNSGCLQVGMHEVLVELERNLPESPSQRMLKSRRGEI